MTDWLQEAIKPKSDQLNADDLVGGRTITVEVLNVRQGNSEQPVEIEIDGGYKPYRPCKSMLRVLLAAWGENPKSWIKQSMTLYNDPDVKFGGVRLGGIRISHVTGINEPLEVLLTTTRSKRRPYTVQPLTPAEKPDYPQDKFDKAFPTMKEKIKSGEWSPSKVIAQCEKTGKLSQGMIDQINAVEIPADE